MQNYGNDIIRFKSTRGIGISNKAHYAVANFYDFTCLMPTRVASDPQAFPRHASE